MTSLIDKLYRLRNRRAALHRTAGPDHVMLDLETLGTRPGCVVLTIGAVVMTPRGTGDYFYAVLGRQQQLDAGLTVNPETEEWWSKQDAQVRADAFGEGLVEAQAPLRVLLRFREWLRLTAGSSVRVWGNGAGFDQPILQAVYEAYKLEAPWKFYNERCYRTLKNMVPDIKIDKSGYIAHNALDDAMMQAHHAIELLNTLPNGWEA